MPPRAFNPNAIGAHRSDDVLDMLFAPIVQRQSDLALEMIVGGTGDKDAAGLAKLFEAGSNVDTIAKQIIAIHDDVAEIDSDPKNDPSLARRDGLYFCNLLLRRNRAVYRIDNGTKLSDCAIAHELHDAAMMLGKQRIDHFGAKLPDCGQGARFIALDEPGIADNIGSEDRYQPPFDMNCFHGYLRGIRRFAAPLWRTEPLKIQNSLAHILGSDSCASAARAIRRGVVGAD